MSDGKLPDIVVMRSPVFRLHTLIQSDSEVIAAAFPNPSLRLNTLLPTPIAGI